MSKEPYIVITGAAGMIGSGVVRYLNDRGKTQLLLVDDLKTGEKWKNLVGKTFVDIISKHHLFSWLEGKDVDAIIHLGACSDTVETNADYLLENNFRFTLRLAEWAVQNDVRFVYASSAATYGDGSLGFSDDEALLGTLRPLNMYGFSKHMTDLWMQRQGILDRVVGLKYFNVFGPNEYHKGRMASMVVKMLPKAHGEGVVQLFKSTDPKYTNGGQMRDFIYVKDAVKITCAFLEPENRHIGGIFNVGLGKATTWNYLAEVLFHALGKKNNVHYIDMPHELARQYQNYTCATMDKLHKILRVDTTPIKEAVCEYVQKYLMQSERW